MLLALKAALAGLAIWAIPYAINYIKQEVQQFVENRRIEKGRK